MIEKIPDSKDLTYGFDTDVMKYGDMMKFGIMDPTKVVRSALQNAASVANLLLTTEAIISEIPEKKEASTTGDMSGGMDDDSWSRTRKISVPLLGRRIDVPVLSV